MNRIAAGVMFFVWVSFGFAKTRIMLMGDSITEGMESTDGLGFRNDIRFKLQDLGFPFALVGSMKWKPYQGHFIAGATIDDFFVGPGGNGSFDAAPDMDRYQPQVVMIHLGTNDVSVIDLPIGPYSEDHGTTFANTISGNLARMIVYLLQWKNGTRGSELNVVFLSSIIPKIGREAKITAFNEQVDRIVEDSEAGLSPDIPAGSLIVVDHYGSFDPETMLSGDGVHPNDDGYEHMGEVYFQALRLLPMHLIPVSGEESRGPSGGMASPPLAVRVNDDFGDGVSGAEVVFQTIEGDAFPEDGQPVLTDGSGNAFGRIRLGQEEVSTVMALANLLIDSITTFTVRADFFARVQGHVLFWSGGRPVPDVRVLWVQEETWVDTTDAGGSFDFRTVPYFNPMTVTVQKERWGNASEWSVTFEDALLTARAAVGADTLSEQALLASDVDGDQQLSMRDAALLLRSAAGVDCDGYSRIGAWMFVPDSLHCDSLVEDLEAADFTAVLSGDVRGQWTPPGWPGEAPDSRDPDHGGKVRKQNNRLSGFKNQRQ